MSDEDRVGGGTPGADAGDTPDAWARMIAAFRTQAPRGEAPPWLEQRVMAEIEALPEPGPMARLLAWLAAPTSVRISPLAAGLVTVAFAVVIALPDARSDRLPDPTGLEPPVQSIVYVRFVLDAPQATSVAVAGDFSEWEPTHVLEDADGDGVWTGRVPIEPGVHEYMFLIDGRQWQTDPYAERYQDDGFGNRNAILAVAAGA